MDIRGKSIYAFVDAANMFYGGEKSLRWRIDYEKLFKYLKEKFKATKVFYYSGVDVEGYKEEGKEIDLNKLVAYFEAELLNKEKTEVEIVLLGKHLERAKFYQDLKRIGYDLRIKATKVFTSIEGTTTTKANCDVDLTFDMMRFMSQYNEAVVLSGDGDFAPILEYLKRKNKKIRVLARFERSAREIKEIAGDDFVDFKSIREEIEAEKKVKKEESSAKGGLTRNGGVRSQTLPQVKTGMATQNIGKIRVDSRMHGNDSSRKAGIATVRGTETRNDRNSNAGIATVRGADLQGDSSQVRSGEVQKKSFRRRIPEFRKGF